VRLLERVRELEKLDRRFRETAIPVINAIVVQATRTPFDAPEQAAVIRDQLRTPGAVTSSADRVSRITRVLHITASSEYGVRGDRRRLTSRPSWLESWLRRAVALNPEHSRVHRRGARSFSTRSRTH
jgi:hypothetical protein